MTPVSYSAILIYWGVLAGMGLYLADELLVAICATPCGVPNPSVTASASSPHSGFTASVLLRSDPASRAEAIDVLERARANIEKHNLQSFALGIIVAELAEDAATRGHLDEAIERLRAQAAMHSSDAPFIYFPCPAEALIELLTERGRAADLQEAHRLIEFWRMRRPNAPAMDLWWLKSRALLAEADGDSRACLGTGAAVPEVLRGTRRHERIAEAERSDRPVGWHAGSGETRWRRSWRTPHPPWDTCSR